MPRMVVLRGAGGGRVFEILDRATIGRLPCNDIQLAGDKVSRRHAEIVREGGRYFISDVGSRNGVLVNGRMTGRAELSSGDRIEIGDAVLLFELDEAHDYPTQQIEGNAEPGRHSPVEPALFSEDSTASAEKFARSVDVDGEHEDPASVLERLREANRKLKALHDVSDVLYETFDPHEMMHKLLDVVLDIFRADRAVILLYDEPGEKMRPAAARNRRKTSVRLAVSQTVVDYVAGEMRSVVSADALSDPRFDPSESIALQRINSVMCVPLPAKGRSLGVLYVDSRSGAQRFDKDQMRLLTIIARQASSAIANARSFANLRQEREELRRQVNEKYTIVGESEPLRRVLEDVRRVAGCDTTVLICGETGVGKELIARAVHDASPRADGPFVIVNCASVPETLLESELFGHEKGSFTGAEQRKLGKFEVANRGTLFLDEVGEISLGIQTKLLRAVEQKVFDRVGGTKPVSVDVRIVAATNRDLEEMVRQGKFREDLYYRLAVVPIHVPPLRERRSDIPRLAEHFLAVLAREIGRRQPEIGQEALDLMIAYDWPGNIRELKNAMERAILLDRTGTIEPDDLPPTLVAGGPARAALLNAETGEMPATLLPLANAIAAVERRAIRDALQLANGVKSKAAEMLGISRPTLDKKLKQYGDLQQG